MTDHPLSSDCLAEIHSYPIGVIIPTYNRAGALLSCLKHLERQTWTDFEVIVVDDGSTDSTPELLEEYLTRGNLHLRYIRQDNSGPARARNVAISILKSPICLMIGDDIFASPTLVSTHLELHRRRPEVQVAGLGLTCWSDSGQTVTKFMRWLEDGIQFAYKDLLLGVPPDRNHFYTSNLSLKTKLLQENAFNESFTRASMEDMELAYRLEMQYGLDLVFIPDALAHHLHPTSFRQACKRMTNVGVATRQFHAMWPNAAPPPRKSPVRRFLRKFSLGTPWLLPFITPIADILTRVWCPNPLMRYVLMSYFCAGYESSVSHSQKLTFSSGAAVDQDVQTNRLRRG